MADQQSRPTAVYQPELFDVHSIQEAMEIIVTSVEGTIRAGAAGKKRRRSLVEDIGTYLGLGPDNQRYSITAAASVA